jgi:hypothetical protein
MAMCEPERAVWDHTQVANARFACSVQWLQRAAGQTTAALGYEEGQRDGWLVFAFLEAEVEKPMDA